MTTALLALIDVHPVSADVRTEARSHFRRGMALIEQGDVDVGVAELERAYATLPHPNVLYNIASAYAEAGRYADALDYFERYLLSEPPDREEVRAIVQAIESRVAASQSAASEAEAAPAPAVEPSPGVTVDATEEEILALEEAANQIETLAEVAQSEALRMRASRLRELASSLREAEAVEAPTLSSGSAQSAADSAVAPTDSAQPAEGIEIASGSAGDLYEETVISASRFAQNPLDAPNSTTIITRQDIRLSGLTNIGELLRRAAGVDVMRLAYSDVQVGIRGFNQLQSPRVLFLINGRSTYLDAFGSTFLSTQPISVEDIERIEVIRGPASALYGANGFSGVVNIVTTEPGGEPGTRAALGVGSRGQVHGQLATSGRQGRLGYRISGGYDQGDRFSFYFDPNRTDIRYPVENPNRSLQSGHANASLEYRINRDVRTFFESGVNYSRFNFLGASTNLDFYATGPQAYMMAGIESGWGGIRAFWNHFSATADLVGPAPYPNDFSTNTFDVEGEFAREFHFLVDHNLHVGASYRRKQADWNLFPEEVQENHYAGFMQDTMQLADKLILVAGLRLDRHPLLERIQFSPRAALIVRPTEESAIRLTAGRAFRTQTFLESYLLNIIPTPIPAVTAVGIGSVWRERFFGAAPLSPEEIISTELGFSLSSDKYSFDANAYLNRVQGLIIQVQETQAFTIADTVLVDVGGFDEDLAAYPFGLGGFENDDAQFTVVGGELMARVFPVRGLDVYANYAINKTFISGNPLRESERRTSLHMINSGIQYRTTVGLDLAADFHYASEQVWPEQIASASSGVSLAEFPLPAYYLLNARIGWRLLDDDLELGVTGYNVTNNQHRQHPFGQVIDARVMGTVAYRF
jgi:outer membrane receptor for ferrienterochelin and colicin